MNNLRHTHTKMRNHWVKAGRWCMLTDKQIQQAAEVLVEARHANQVIDGIPEHCRPHSLGDAYAVQDRMIALLGWESSGWFCACTNTVIQDMLGLAEPYCARLFKDYTFDSPSVLAQADYPPIVLECEFGFRLGQDLPPRETPYARDEVEAAIATMHPTIEVVAGHLRDWTSQDVFSVIADNGTDGALVVGKGTTDWRDMDLIGQAVELTVNGKLERSGTGANVLGDPIGSFVWLANSRAGAQGPGLKAGDIHNTGTATEIYWVTPGDEAVADFGALGEVCVMVEA